MTSTVIASLTRTPGAGADVPVADIHVSREQRSDHLNRTEKERKLVGTLKVVRRPKVTVTSEFVMSYDLE